MKIQRIDTRAFLVDENLEKKGKSKFGGGILRKFLNFLSGEELVEIKKSYRPLARFKAERIEKVQKGVAGTEITYEKRENYFYVDMSNADLYYISKNRIIRFEILRRLIDLPRTTAKTLGRLMRTAFIYREELDENDVFNLMNLGFISIYQSTCLTIFARLWDELNPEQERPTLIKDRVKSIVKIPRFNDDGYDLSLFLEVGDIICEDYQKDTIKYPIERISELLSDIFDAKIFIESITFMPYLRGFYRKRHKKKSKAKDMYFPVCFTSKFHIRKPRIKKGEKLKPIALCTEIGVEGSVPIEESTINFSDVADLENVKKEIMESIVYPLLNPELAKEFGKKGGGAILLYGPPGCGKTYIAKATIGECGLPFFNVNISDLISKGVKAEAESLHKVFEEAARNSPSIIFFDEIDAIGGRRTEAMEYEEKMEIDQFLMEMDGVESLSKDILIIAATNMPWNIDPALRRSVRFTKQIFIPPPDKDAREEIFRVHTRDKPISRNVDFKKLAELTEGYAASDIKAICDRAAEIPWEETLKGGEEREIEMDDFLQAIKEQKSSLIPWFKEAYKALKESGEMSLFEDFAHYILKYGGEIEEVKKPDISFKDVGNLEEVKDIIRRELIYPIKNPEIAEKFKKEIGGAILLYGPPGCGKTYIAKATAGECDVPFFNINITDILSEREGVSEKNLHYIFEKAINNAPAVLFFDEIDAIVCRRDIYGSGSEKRLVNAFLTELDGFKKATGLVILAATNMPWNIDPALRRAGRFTKQIFVPPPDKDAREEIFRLHTRDKPISRNVNFKKLAELTEGYAASDIKAICDRAAEIPWEETLKGGEEREIEMDDFLQAIKEQKSSLMAWYRAAEKQLIKSGEQDIYKELFDSIKKFKKIKSREEEIKEILDEEREKLGLPSRRERESIKRLLSKKSEIERMIEITRKKYRDKEIDEKTFSKLIAEYEKRLIETEVKIETLKKKR